MKYRIVERCTEWREHLVEAESEAKARELHEEGETGPGRALYWDDYMVEEVEEVTDERTPA